MSWSLYSEARAAQFQQLKSHSPVFDQLERFQHRVVGHHVACELSIPRSTSDGQSERCTVRTTWARKNLPFKGLIQRTQNKEA